MIVIITRWLIITVAIMLSSLLIPGIRIDSLPTAVIAAGLLGMINIFIRPLLIILTLPLNIITLGLFSFIINAFLLKLVAWFVTGLEVDGFFAAFLGALVISLTNWLANRFIVASAIRPDRPDRPIRPPRPDKHDCIDLEQKGNGKWE
ncbi:MAG: phage holin family protein [Deltaproteobacteria bacterium HGW-Deltaproteobacteria-12]|nr:MAG: phage holin family protein [Deltaproteobacteria bacterium HGW-Deltaproteobacteria-12]